MDHQDPHDNNLLMAMSNQHFMSKNLETQHIAWIIMRAYFPSVGKGIFPFCCVQKWNYNEPLLEFQIYSLLGLYEQCLYNKIFYKFFFLQQLSWQICINFYLNSSQISFFYLLHHPNVKSFWQILCYRLSLIGL